MILSIEEALELIRANAGEQPVETASLNDALGRVLAEEVHAAADSPPFTKALMDGFAVRSEDVRDGRASLRVQETILAGATPSKAVSLGTATRIMTGAPMPAGADAVVMVERTKTDGDQVAIEDPRFREGQNVLPRGTEWKSGEAVLHPGRMLGPAELGLLANLGRTSPRIYRKPTVAVLTTGDEIVPPDQTPGPGQIRDSNGATLFSLARQAGTSAKYLGIARDNREDLEGKIALGLKSDFLLLTGGVSAGAADLVPDALARQGVQKVFHKVRFKPGQPIWFGSHAGGLVFGLPGNPVSVLACFELFVRTAIRARQKLASAGPEYVQARLAREFQYRTDRPTYYPARLYQTEAGARVEPLAWSGSADLRGAANANGLLVCTEVESTWPADAWMRVLPLVRSGWDGG